MTFQLLNALVVMSYMTKLQLMQVWKFIAEMYYYCYSLFDQKMILL